MSVVGATESTRDKMLNGGRCPFDEACGVVEGQNTEAVEAEALLLGGYLQSECLIDWPGQASVAPRRSTRLRHVLSPLRQGQYAQKLESCLA